MNDFSSLPPPYGAGCSCCSCRFSHQAPPTLVPARPSWGAAFKRLFSPDCCFPPPVSQQRIQDHGEYSSGFALRDDATEKLKVSFNNSSTTCQLSDDDLDSSESSIEEGRGWDLPENQGLRPLPPPSPKLSSPRRVSPNQHRRSKTSASNLLLKSPKKKAEHRSRARLLSNGNITVSSCNTTDSLHRRSSVAVLPALDKIWRQPALAPAGALGKPFNVPPPPLASVDLVRRPSTIRGRTLSTGSQLTQTSGLTQVTFENGDESHADYEESETTEEDEEDNTESEHGSDELSFDLSESDLGSENDTKLSTSRAGDVETSADASATKHVRILSDCSTNLEHGVSAMVVATASKTTQGVPQAKELNKVWVGKESSRSNDKSGVVVEENEVQYHPASYLPGLPIPDAATVTAVASIFTAGWTAVFWESPIDTVSSKLGNEVPNVTLDNLYFIQLLPGGMLQLTPAVNEGTMGKTILVMPKCQTVSGGGGQWSVQLVSRRAGHCLVIAIAASTGSSKQQRELYLLPVHLPPAYRSQMPNNSMQVSTDLTKSSNDNNMSNLLFTPFRNVDSKKKSPSLLFAPNHQHDAALYLRFAMDSALTADALRGQQ